jgi:hypothetical protein
MIQEQTFTGSKTETFQAIRKAEAYLKKHGFIVGSMECDKPIGFAPAAEYNYISKWSNMDRSDYAKLTGRLETTGHRHGDVTLVLSQK